MREGSNIVSWCPGASSCIRVERASHDLGFATPSVFTASTMILKLLTFAALCLPLCSARPGKPGANDIEAAAATTKGKGRMSSEGDGISALSLEPSYPPGAGTTPYCTYWIDYEGYETCQDITDFWKITMDDFMRWVS